ncbi:flavodoxin family protein [Candidatus Chloroploca sp. Khr17]|uniref:flavodoxin family protein n=1 Tax=Candidatus Chloroploca sp. Khr17 TaxID=2496869 RepID=UPI00101C638C|nr:flavodoxin family protein [Candidatus Chloroploca sp. Khr17]
MNALVIYDSVFGNTETIAQVIAAALGTQAIPVSQAEAGRLCGLDLLVVGSPTRGFRPTEGMAKLLHGLPKNHLTGVRVAAFDTRIALETINSRALRFLVDKGGYAASTLAKTLEKKGGVVTAPPEGFFVTGEQGPLKEGEGERAAAWAGGLGTRSE